MTTLTTLCTIKNRKELMNDNLEITRLTIELGKNIKKDVKKRAAIQNLTIKQWILEAIYEKIKQEKHLGFE